MLPLLSKRYLFIYLVFMIGFGIVGYRLIFLGIYRDRFSDFIQVARQRVRTLEAERGNIIDRQGRCLATQQKVYDVGVDLTQIRECDRTYLPQLASLLSIPLNTLDTFWEKSKRRWKPLLNDVSESLYKKIMALKIFGVYGNPKQQRSYLHTTSLSHIVGFINKENTPVCGIEKMMHFYLKGQQGYLAYEVNGKNEEVRQYRKERIAPVKGCTVQLTIDNQIQKFTEQALMNAQEKYKPESLHALVTNPNSGEILALVNVPFFDANHYKDFPIDVLTNKAVSNIYEPGSVFKTITVSAALDCNAIQLNDSFNCGLRSANYHGKELPLPKDWKSFNQVMSVADILHNSSNKGIVQIGFKLGAERLYHYGKMFGFGDSTLSGFEGETKGIFRPIKQWDGLTITRLPIGHSVACSLFQMHYAMGTVINGGTLMYPQIIRHVYDDKGNLLLTFPPKVHRQVLKPQTSQIMRSLLLLSENSKAFIPHYNVSGKTGTTQKIVDNHYSHTQHIASFSGFFPNRNPQIQITITVDSPHVIGTGYGSIVAAPIFKEIAENIIAYMGILPEPKLLTDHA